MKIKLMKLILMGFFSSVIFNCAPLKPELHPDYKSVKPRTVLVLPPENTTAGTEIEEQVYPIIFEKLSRRGYHCIPPELARTVFNANKLEDAGRINSLPPMKFKEIFGVDAILKVVVTDWESKYVVISSNVNVGFDMQLIRTQDGSTLWALKRLLSKAPGGNNNGGLIGALVNAAVHAAFTPYEPIAEENADTMIKTIPKGHYANKTTK